MQKPGVFLAAMLYGTSWAVGLLNLWAALVALEVGLSPVDYLPMILLPLGIILFVHFVAGWFPFRHRQT